MEIDCTGADLETLLSAVRDGDEEAMPELPEVWHVVPNRKRR